MSVHFDPDYFSMMSGTAKKRTIEAFFKPPAKKTRVDGGENEVKEQESSAKGEEVS